MQQTGRVIAGLAIALGLTMVLTSPAFSQSNQQTAAKIPVLKPIDAKSFPKTNPIIYPVNFEKVDKYQGRIDVKSDGNWRVIRFSELPPQVSLAVAEKSPGYPNDREAIFSNQWYSFKTAFSFIITVEKTAPLPIEIPYEVSTVKMPPQRQLSAANVRLHVTNPDNVDPPQFSSLKLRFEAVAPTASANPSGPLVATPTATPSAPVTNEDGLFPSWVPFPDWLIFVVGGVVLLIVFIALSTQIGSLFKRFKKRPDRNHNHHKNRTQDHRISPESDIDDLRKKIVAHQSKPRRFFKFLQRRSKKEVGGRGESLSGYDDGSPPTNVDPSPPRVNDPVKNNVPQPSTIPPVVGVQLVETPRIPDLSSSASGGTQPLDDEASNRLKVLAGSVEKLQNAHKTLAERVNEMLDPEKGLRSDVSRMFDDFKKDQQRYVDGELEVLQTTLSNQQNEINEAKKISENALANVQSQVKHFEETVADLIAKAKQRETELSDRYSKLLGEVLGFNVQTLKEGNFDVIVEEAGRRLNSFFSQQPAKVDGLNDLQRRAEAINSEMQTTLERVRQIKPALEKLHPYAERAKGLANELRQASSLQGQSRNFKATLDFPVAKFTGARETFLEDLGKAVKEQIDRLVDPHAFWSKELEAFATSDIVAVADICDVEVTGKPGANQELEQGLSELFRQAGLTAIVPVPGEPFKPGEQHLIDMVAGSPTASQTIKRVVKRGFYYKGNAKEQLIRKAGVDVYR